MLFYLMLLLSPFFINAIFIDDINVEVAKHLAKNAVLNCAIKDIKALSLTNKYYNRFFNDLNQIDSTIILLSNQFDLSHPCVGKALKMTGCVNWFRQLESTKPPNINELFVEALLQNDSYHMLSLLNMGAAIDVNVESKPALIFLVTKKNYSMVRMLLKNDANVNIQDEIGETPLICATKLNDVPMLDLLNEFGANKSIKADDGYTSLDWAMLLS